LRLSRCFDSACAMAAACCSSTDLLSHPRAMCSIIASTEDSRRSPRVP
jgi:hypothetical protein